MTPEEFERLISQDPALATPIHNAARAVPPRTRGTFGTPLELAAIALLFPVVSYVVKGIGLPWLYEAKRYTELWRLKFHNWIDKEYRKHGFDPDEAEAFGEKLRRELESVTDANAQKSWERFAELLRQQKPDE
jgi:hypothetical protein